MSMSEDMNESNTMVSSIEQLQAENALLQSAVTCWKEQAEMLQHQNDDAFVELRGHIDEQDKQIAALHAEVERLKTVPMKYRRMAFNAQLQVEIAEQRVDHMKLVEENHELRQQLAASQLEAKRLRYAIFDMAVEEPAHSWKVAKKIEALSSPASTEVLDAYVAEKVKSARIIDEKQIAYLFEERSALTRQRDLAVSAATKARNGAHQAAMVCPKKLHMYPALLNMVDVVDSALAAIKESET